MKIAQSIGTQAKALSAGAAEIPADSVQLALVFGSTKLLEQEKHLQDIRESYPNAHVLGCSTAGEIAGTQVLDDSLVVTAVRFDHTNLAAAEVDLAEVANSRGAGRELAGRLDPRGLKHVLLLSDGLAVNGSDLVKGLAENLPEEIGISGGLAGDGAQFQQTLVCSGNRASQRKIAAVGFYGDRLRIGCASMGGWDTFGPDRVITKSKANVLYELDGKSALTLYKEYLGDHAAKLPASGLLFPLSVRHPSSSGGVVRTILSVNEAEGSMTFAGDVPEGFFARLMRANFERLIDGATGAAKATTRAGAAEGVDLAILISCVGRKLVLKQRVEEEVEAVQNVLGPAAVLTGFYSYGEISPFTPSAKCELHNQTMTLTTFREG
jgi:hypothetical protein